MIRAIPLGELLINAGVVTPENLQVALNEQKVSQMRLGEILIKNGYMTEAQLGEALSSQLDVPFVSLVNIRPQQQAISLVSETIAERLNVMPLSVSSDGRLVVAMSDPLNTFAVDALRMLLNREIEIQVATSSDIRKAITSFYKMQTSLKDAMADIQRQESSLGTDVVTISSTSPQDVTDISADDAPVIRLVNTILEQAVREKASDIHIEPLEAETRVRLRIDGTLFKTTDIPKNLHPPLIARIKILSEMNIAEKRRPQDGRILIMVAGQKIDLRVSTLPSIYGEKAVLRLLVQDSQYVGIDKLGFDEQQINYFRTSVDAAHGIVLVTGPTGSGKSTSLYSLLEIINKPETNIITVEDPVEYTMNGINQVQINEKIGFTFSAALRSILRQDPDKLMVGEVRDTETAHLAVRAALTGHLVLSTLHTNDAPSSINRLVDMGVPNFLLASSIRTIAAQRLVRKLCPQCKKEFEFNEEVAKQLGAPIGTKAFLPVGCPACRFTGYSGRTVIAEVMMIDKELREMISNAAQTHEIREYARSHGMTTLRESAFKKVKAGITSVEEMLLATMFD
ncbi:MAG: ATPase, T2SS/T4P/T4SS family [Synergistota bacterium]|nr:ATPase, T2SS/T4P/T4SS family [Synergistota bacterium]